MARTLPNESSEYRKARKQLLEAEIELRAKTEEVATLRRKLPLGGAVKEDYVFYELDSKSGKKTPVKMSELFEKDKNTLFLYSFMWAADDKNPCPLCTSFLTSLDGAVPQLTRRINVAVVARAGLVRLQSFAKNHKWAHLRLLTAEKESTYPEDYWAEKDGKPMPIAHVFKKHDGEIRHFWGSEMLYSKDIESGDSRHIDTLWPLWNVLDLCPEGRGKGFYPVLD